MSGHSRQATPRNGLTADDIILDDLIQLSEMVESGEVSATAAKEVFIEWRKQPAVAHALKNFGKGNQ